MIEDIYRFYVQIFVCFPQIVEIFQSLIDDLFPGMVLDKKGYPDLERTIDQIVTNAGTLVNHKDWNLKIIQLFETQRVRWGIMTLGPTGSNLI